MKPISAIIAEATDMQMDAEECVFLVLARRSGLDRSQISASSRLVQDLKIDGDDAIDALLEISKQCGMEITHFDTSLYFRSEPNLLSIFRSKRSPQREMTVGQMVAAARQGQLTSE